MRNKYYKILGLSSNATAQEIKRAYRKLVLKYHPDKDPSASAHEQFLKVQEAYEILTGQKDLPVNSRANGRATSNNSNQNSQRNRASKKEVSEQEKAKRYKKAQERLQKQKEREFFENERYYKRMSEGSLWKIFRTIVLVSSFLALAFITDTFLSTKMDKIKIESVSKTLGYRGFSGMEVVQVETKNNGTLWVSSEMTQYLSKFENIYLEKTAWMNDSKNLVYFNRDGSVLQFRLDFTAVNYLFFVLFVLLIPLITRFIKSKTTLYSVLFHFCVYFYGLILLILFYSNDRWAHLLTFGFL